MEGVRDRVHEDQSAIAHVGRIPHTGACVDWSGWRIAVVGLAGPRRDQLVLTRIERSVAATGVCGPTP